MIALAPWQTLLNSVGWVVAQIYDFVPNYGVTIILLTILIRVVLLPLGIKQVRSMQHMQIVQPKIKQIQQKYKGNKQRQQEEIMKLYKEYGVNPFSGCWPVLLQFPILIAMYSVLRWPQQPVHIPEGTQLYNVIQQQIPEPPTPEKLAQLPGPPDGTSFLGMNLLCSAIHAGKPDAELASNLTLNGEKVIYTVDCGNDAVDRIPYYVFAALMFVTTFYQQRQMQKATPPGGSQQQQLLLKIMPLMFGVFGVFFPAGLVLYWATSNSWQIGQQYFMLKSRPTEEQLAQKAKSKPQKAEKKGFMASMMERAEGQRQAKGGANPKPGTLKPGNPKPGNPKPGSGPQKPDSGGGNGGRDPKKRPKR